MKDCFHKEVYTMSEDSIVRQLEVFINDSGKIEDLKHILSTCANDEELLKALIWEHRNK